MDPFKIFHRWMRWADKHHSRPSNEMVLSTVNFGDVSSRMVLLKKVNENGFVFFTNYDSEKACGLETHPACCLLFPWGDRQVRIRGIAEKTSREESVEYFNTRPKLSRIGAIASPQSRVIESNTELLLSVAHAALGKIACPEHWGGYRIVPNKFEFWRSGEYRLHTRDCYEKYKDQWIHYKLAP